MAKKRHKRVGYNPESLKNLTHPGFPKGKSGNPAGRPKGAKNFRTVIKELMDTAVDLADETMYFGKHDAEIRALLQMRAKQLGGEICWREATILIQAMKALSQGDTSALAYLSDREEGRPVQAVVTDKVGYESFLDQIPDPNEGQEE